MADNSEEYASEDEEDAFLDDAGGVPNELIDPDRLQTPSAATAQPLPADAHQGDNVDYKTFITSGCCSVGDAELGRLMAKSSVAEAFAEAAVTQWEHCFKMGAGGEEQAAQMPLSLAALDAAPGPGPRFVARRLRARADARGLDSAHTLNILRILCGPEWTRSHVRFVWFALL